jgi:hypothetical protein
MLPHSALDSLSPRGARLCNPVLANAFASEPRTKSRNFPLLLRGEQETFPRFAPISFAKEGSRTPIDASSNRPHRSGCGSASSGMRSPIGVPPGTRCSERTPQLSSSDALPGTDCAGAGVIRPLPPQCSELPRRPVIVPAGRRCRNRPGAECMAPRAGTAPAPLSGIPSRKASFTERDLAPLVKRRGDVKGFVSRADLCREIAGLRGKCCGAASPLGVFHGMIRNRWREGWVERP